MEKAIMTIFAIGVSIFAAGARALWCGHRHHRQTDRRDPAAARDRRRHHRGADRRAA